MPGRPKDWQKIINAQAEVCHWIAPDGTRHPCTPPRHPSPPPSPKHSVVDLTAPPENLELAIAMHFAETATERSTAELLWVLPLLKELCRARVGNAIWSLPRLRDASRQKSAILLVGRKNRGKFVPHD
jgi:hypothetical protein